jgi:hypothetical protein
LAIRAKLSAFDIEPMHQRVCQLLTGLGIPDARSSIGRRSYHAAPIRAEPRGFYPVAVFQTGADWLSSSGVPNARGLIPGSRDYTLTIGTKSGAFDLSTFVAKFEEIFVRLGVP